MIFERITMMILFMNIMLSILFPTRTDPNLNELLWSEQGDSYTLSTDVQDAAGTLDDDTASAIGNFGFIDIIKMIFVAIELFVRLFFATFIALGNLPSALSLIIGVPLGMAYFIGLVQFIRG